MGEAVPTIIAKAIVRVSLWLMLGTLPPPTIVVNVGFDFRVFS